MMSDSNKESKENTTDDGITPLYAASIHLNEMYRELIRAGFTQPEALHLVTSVLLATVSSGLED